MAGYSVTFTVVDNATKQVEQINRRMAAMRAPMERMSKQMQRFIDLSGLRKIADSFSWISRAAGAALRPLVAMVPVLGAITSAATIAGMTKLVSSFAQWGNALSTNADQIGISTDELQKWQDATTRAGGNAQDMTDTLKNLHNVMAEAATGRNLQALAMFRRFGIDVLDANGNLKKTTEVLPQVFAALDSLKDPADRSTVAATLLSDAQNKLYEEYKQSGKPLSEWLALEEKHQRATAQQLDALNRYRLAQAGLATTFSQLGRQVSAVLAENFTPLIEHLDAFVQKNQPQILAAIDSISKQFANWLENVNWDKVQKGAEQLLQALVMMANHLDTILHVAEAIATVFAVKWAVQMVAAIVQVTTALGTAASGAGAVAGGAGLLGALSAIAAIAAPLAAAAAIGKTVSTENKMQKTMEQQAAEQGFQKQGGSVWNPFNKIPKFYNPTTGETLTYEQMQKRLGYGASGMNPFAPNLGRQAPPGPMNLPQENLHRGAAIRDRLSQDLSLTPQQASGIVGNLQAESGLQAVQEQNPLGGGRGGFGWAQWTGSRRTQFEAYAKEHGLSTTSDEANYGFLMQELQQPEYKGMLDKMRAQQGGGAAASSAQIFEAGFERPAVSNAATRGTYAQQYAGVAAPPPTQMAQAQAPPAAPPPAAPVNGSVNVDITHRNAPPDATVTARGSGAVNVAPTRIEHPQLDFATA